MKQNSLQKQFMPGIIKGLLAMVLGFALIWHMWLPAAVAFVALLAVAIGHTFNYQRDYYIPAEEVVRVEDARTEALRSLT
jgi:cytochrome o ubiquinol oxidase subunit 1